MSEFDLSQEQADALIAMAKRRGDEEVHTYPALGGSISLPLVSTDGREDFILDIKRGRIDLLKGTYQNRGRQTLVLVRLDFGGAPHRNPDGEEIPSPHLHVYRETYGDKWAVPVPVEAFPRLVDLSGTLDDFMTYCNVVEQPLIERGLFT
jgi:hypothetical protein